MFSGLQLIKKETLTQVFSCEFGEIFKNTFFHRTPLMATFGEFERASRYLEDGKKVAAGIGEGVYQKGFIKDPLQFLRGIFTKKKSSILKCSKKKIRNHLKETCRDLKWKEKLLWKLNPPTASGVPFDKSDIKPSIRICSKNSYMAKYMIKLQRLRNKFFLLLQKIMGNRGPSENNGKWQVEFSYQKTTILGFWANFEQCRCQTMMGK